MSLLLLPAPKGMGTPYVFEKSSDRQTARAIAVGDAWGDRRDEFAIVEADHDISIFSCDGWLAGWGNVLCGTDRAADEEGIDRVLSPVRFEENSPARFSAAYSLDNGTSVLKTFNIETHATDSLWIYYPRGANGRVYRSSMTPRWYGQLRRDGKPVILVENSTGRSFYGRGLFVYAAGTLDSIWAYMTPGSPSIVKLGHFVSDSSLQILSYSYGCANLHDVDGRSDTLGWLDLISADGKRLQTTAYPAFTGMQGVVFDINQDGRDDALLYRMRTVADDSPILRLEVWEGGDSLRLARVEDLHDTVDVLQLIPARDDTCILLQYRDGHLELRDRRLAPVDSIQFPLLRACTQVWSSPKGGATRILLVQYDGDVIMLDEHLRVMARVRTELKVVNLVQPLLNDTLAVVPGMVVSDLFNEQIQFYTCHAATFVVEHYRPIMASSGFLIATFGCYVLLVLLSRRTGRGTISISRLDIGVLVVGPTGAIREINAAMLPLIGRSDAVPLHSPRDTVVASVPILIHEFLRGQNLAAVHEIEQPYPMELRLERMPDGSVVCSARDRRSEAALKQSLQWAKLLGRLAHRLNGRLQSLKSLTWRLREDVSDEGLKRVQELEANIDDISRQSARMMRLSEMSECPLVPIGLRIFVEQNMPRIAAGLPTPIQLDMQYEAERDMRIAANERALVEVFENLLGNAGASGPSPVRVIVHVSAEEHMEDGTVSRRWAVIRIIDSGTGIDPADMRRLGEPLFSRRPGGTGLGLAIVRQLIALQGGRIDIESNLGQGTCVTLWLEATSPPESGTHPADGSS